MKKTEETTKARKPKEHYFCFKCEVDRSKNNHIEYEVGYHRGKMRILLQRVVGNVWACPKCHTMYFNGNFDKKVEKLTKKRRILIKAERKHKPKIIKIP